MRTAIFAGLALLSAGAANAQAGAMQPVPPGDGITRQGTNPEGQACTPPGFNIGLGAYPQCGAVGGPAIGADSYPPCTSQVTDRCIQTYTRWTRPR